MKNFAKVTELRALTNPQEAAFYAQLRYDDGNYTRIVLKGPCPYEVAKWYKCVMGSSEIQVFNDQAQKIASIPIFSQPESWPK